MEIPLRLEAKTAAGSVANSFVSKAVISSSEMTRDGLLMVIFISLANFFNYLYQLSMGILLSQAYYSILLSLTSLLVIIMVFSQTLTVAMAKYVSSLQARSQAEGVDYFWKSSLKRFLLLGILVFVIFIALSPLLANLLKLDNIIYPVIIFMSLPFLFLLSVNWGVLQGLQRFFHFGFSQALAAVLKVAIGALLIYAGCGIYGGLVAIPVSFALALWLSFHPLQDLPKTRNRESPAPSLYLYASLTMLAMLSLTTLTNIDVILARNFFTPVEAGNYSALSVLGRVAFYAPLGITAAMFPKTAKLHEAGGRHGRLFLKAMLLVLLVTGAVVLIYGLFAGTISTFVFGSKYPLVASHLFTYGLAMAFFGFSFFLTSYLLSLNQTKIAYLLLGVALMQIMLLSLFHTNILTMVNIMLVCGVLSTLLPALYIMLMRRRTNDINENKGFSQYSG
jgi:O-antigen/teichoic acid export membrane protein